MQPLSATGHVWFAAPNQFRWGNWETGGNHCDPQIDEMLVIYPPPQASGALIHLARNNRTMEGDACPALKLGFPRNESD